MPSAIRTLIGVAMFGMVHGQGVILKAVGDKGTSLGLKVDSSNPNDANFISDAEIGTNVVNECGRTLAGGNIDIGENTENALAAGNVTQVKKGSTVKITVDQRNANGTGPFTCDLDETGNAIATGQVVLDTQNGKATSATGQMTLTVTMPNNMTCQGSSAGNVCTVRCRNAQDFGGCIAVQQTDVTALPADNPPSKITGAATLEDVLTQVQQNQKDLPAAIAGNQKAASVDEQGPDIAQAILASDSAIVQSETLELKTKAASANKAAATTAATNTNTGNGKGGKKAKGAAAAAAAAGAAGGNGKGAAAAAAAKGVNAAAAAVGKGKGGKNNKRFSPAVRRKRIVNAGVDFAPDAQN